MPKNCLKTSAVDNIKNKKLFLMDMDGTIYLGNRLFEGTIDFLNCVSKNKGKYIFITNNSSKSISDYINKLRSMGIEAVYDDFYTSTQATIEFLLHNYNDKLIYCMSTKSFADELKRNGIKITTTYSEEVDVVLIAYDTELNYQKLCDVCKILTEQKNIPYIATNPDLVCPVENGYIPDCGSMANMIKCATGRFPIFIGKPEPTMINYCMNKFGYTKEETLVVGDRLYTDIASGNNAGVDTICVLSGETTSKDIKESQIKPTYILNDIKELYCILKEDD